MLRARRDLMNTSGLSERDICTKFTTPALARAGWNVQTQVREEVAEAILERIIKPTW